MATQRPAFAKRDREMKLKDKARAKAERRAARKAAPRPGHGPPIEGDEVAGETSSSGETAATNEAPAAAGAAPVGSTTPGRPG
jgi:hypothetical protein